MDLGLLLFRLVLAVILYLHATQKLFGWFSGPGLDRAATLFESLGQRPGRRMVMFAAACEASGSLLVALGLLTPLGAAILAGTMMVAAGSLTITKGTVWNAAGGGEYPLVLATFAILLGFAGPGRWSVDNAIGAPWVTRSNGNAAIIGITVLLVAALAAGVVLARTRAMQPSSTGPSGPAPSEGPASGAA
jgi:putative oxidoreductase